MRMSSARGALAVVVIAAGVGCMKEPISRIATNNDQFDVELLFTHDGCRVYRFKDTTYHYFARCDGAATTTTSDTEGKGGQTTIESTVAPSSAGVAARPTR